MAEKKQASEPTYEPPNFTAWQKEQQKQRRRWLTTLLVIVIIFLLVACGALYFLLSPRASLTPKKTNGVSWIHSIYGFGTTRDQLHHPSDVAIAPGGDSFWVADATNFRLIEYNMNGTLKRVVSQDAKGTKFNNPNRIAVASDGSVYVAEQTYNHVLVFDRNFTLMQTLEVETPMSLAVNNEMAVVGSRGGFAAFKRDGTFIGKVGKWGTAEDQFDVVSAVQLDGDNNVYALDTYNNRLSKYDQAGDKVWMIALGYPGNVGAGGSRSEDEKELQKKFPARLQMPMGLTLDGAGRCVVIDMFDFSVAAFKSADGSFVKKWGAYGRQDGYFNYPSALTYSRQRDVFIAAEAALGRVQIFALAGSSDNPLAGIRRNLGDVLKACCLPALLIVVILAAYALYNRRKKRQEESVVEPEGEPAGGDALPQTGNNEVQPGESQLHSLAEGGETNERNN